MSEFEPFDDQLAQALQGRAGSGTTSVAGAHEAVLARASHIRRRRAATMGAAAMLALLIGGVVLLPRGGGDTIAPSDTGDVLPSVDDDTTIDDDNEIGPISTIDEALEVEIDDDSTSSITDDSADTTVGSGASAAEPAAAPVTTDTSVAGTSVAGTTVASGTESTVSDTTPSSGSTETSVTASSPPTTNDDGSSTTSTGSSTSTSEVARPPIAPFTKTYPSPGGSITVSWNGSALSLLAVAPAEGFQGEIENEEPLRIRVRFRSDTDDARIEVRVSDGVLIETIS